MAELATTPDVETAGQAEGAPDGTTSAAPESTPGQGADQGADATGQAAAPEADDFFDPANLPDDPEVQKAYKQLRGSYTRKMQALSERLKKAEAKIQAYDAFEADPVNTMQRIAKEMGFTLSKGQAAQVLEGDGEWQPQSWQEVLNKATEMAEERLMKQFAPIFQTVRQTQAQSIEAQLDEISPEWREYEGEMRENLKLAPHLAQNIAKLYRISVPDEVYMRRATQEAIRRLESKTRQAAVGSKSTKPKTTTTPKTVSSFDDAVQEAKRRLAEQGE